MEYIDLRSDTVTQPTLQMRKAMAEAICGDDKMDGDPTVIELEKQSAELLGKEAALYVPTGSMGNTICLNYHSRKFKQIVCPDECHIIQYEAGSVVYISRIQTKPLKTGNGILSREMLEKEDLENTFISFENPTSVGCVVKLERMKELYDYAQELGVPIHLDGARLFNAAATLKVEPKEIAKYSDTVLFCLSKALGSPIGSMICGSHEFIKEAREIRKMLGGSMRQSGILAAAGLISINQIRFELEKDHEMTKLLAKKLSELPQLKVLMDLIEINMMFFYIPVMKYEQQEDFRKFLINKKIKISIAFGPDKPFRFMLHHFIREKEVNKVVESIKEYLQDMK